MKRAKKWMQKVTLRNRILILNLIIITLSTTVFVVAGNQFIMDVSFDKAKIQTEREVELIGNSMDLAMTSMIDYVIKVSIDNRMIESLKAYGNEDISFYQLDNELSSVVNENLGISNLVTGCGIIAGNGDVINISPYPKEESETIVLNLEQFNDTTDERIKWYGPRRVKHNNGMYSNNLIIKKNVVGLYDPEYLGAIYMYVDTSFFRNIYNSASNLEDDSYMLVDDHGTVLSSNLDIPLGINFNVLTTDILDSNKYHIIEQQLNTEKWTLYSAIELSTYNNTYLKYVYMLLVLAMAEFAVSMVLSGFMARSVSKPVHDLVDIMGRIQDGDRKVRADLVVSEEIHLLQTTFNQLMDSNDELVEQVYETQKNIRKYEMMLMQAQIKPHFLYNALGTIGSFIKLDMKEEAVDSLNSLAIFFRLSLSEGNEVITLAQEIELVRNYLIIQRYRYVDVLDFNIDVDQRLNQYVVPKITLQPVIENAIYHGIKPKETMDKSIIDIKTEQVDDQLHIQVTDNGVGMYPFEVNRLMDSINDVDSGTNFGLRSVHQRIKLMFGDVYGLSVRSEKDQYTQVTIVIPIKE